MNPFSTLNRTQIIFKNIFTYGSLKKTIYHWISYYANSISYARRYDEKSLVFWKTINNRISSEITYRIETNFTEYYYILAILRYELIEHFAYYVISTVIVIHYRMPNFRVNYINVKTRYTKLYMNVPMSVHLNHKRTVLIKPHVVF